MGHGRIRVWGGLHQNLVNVIVLDVVMPGIG